MILLSLKYRKNRKEWLLTFDNGESLIVNDNIKVKYSLQPHMDIPQERYNTLKTETESFSAHEKAIELLSYREHSSSELRTKLLQKGFPRTLTDTVIENMMSRGYVDDERFAGLYFRELMRQGNYGPLMIKKKMLEKGVNSQIIEKKITSISQDEWKQYAFRLLNKKMQKIRNKGENQREIILRYLLNKGFEYGCIESLVKDVRDNEENA